MGFGENLVLSIGGKEKKHRNTIVKIEFIFHTIKPLKKPPNWI